MVDASNTERIHLLEEQVVDLTLISQELVQALALLVGNLEEVAAISRQDSFRLSANHLSDRLQGVLRRSLGDDLSTEGVSFEGEHLTAPAGSFEAPSEGV